MLCWVVQISNCFNISLHDALVLLSVPEHQRCWLFQSCSCTGVSGKPSCSRTMPGCPAKWSYSEIPYWILVLCPGIRRHQGALSMADGPGNVESWDFSCLQEKFPWNNLNTHGGWLNLSLPHLSFLLVFAGLYVCFDAEAAALGKNPMGSTLN